MTEKPEKLHKNPIGYKAEMDKINDNTDKDQMGKVASDISEVNDAVEDVPADREWTEEIEGDVAPIEKSGESEIDRDGVNEKFSKECSFEADTLVTGKDSGKNPKHAKTDSPADETPME